MWRLCGLRSAGFPVSALDSLADPSIVEAAEKAPDLSADHDRYAAAYRGAADRSVGALRALVDDPRFREAVAWQNPAIVHGWMERLAESSDSRKLGKSRYLRAVAGYAQRYATKNDTIGFFGPVGWASWDPTQRGMRVVPGHRLLRERTVYFEDWAIDTLARTMSKDPGLRPWLVPRMVAGCWHDGMTVHRPYASPVRLSPSQSALLALCDGRRHVTAIARMRGLPGTDGIITALRQLDEWCELGIVQLDLTDHVMARPEAALRQKLQAVPDIAARERALRALTRLERARDDLAASRGQPKAIAAGMVALGEVFGQLTDEAPDRRPGEMYAGRTLVYEDSRRDVDITLGSSLLTALGPPLGIVLDAGSWLINRAGMVLYDQLRTLVERYIAQTGSTGMPLPALLARATRLLHPAAGTPAALASLYRDFQDRWAQVLSVPGGTRRHLVSSQEIAARAGELLPRSVPPWPGAVHLCPDVMIAAADVRDIDRGAFTFVLGELHLAANTLQARPFVEQHADPRHLLAAVESDHRQGRIYSVPTRRSALVTARTYPSALLPASYTYWCLYDDSGGANGSVVPATAMTVHLEECGLVVEVRPDGRRLDLMHVLDEQLSWAVVNAFRPLPARGHQPRVTIDDLVLHRESWYANPIEVEWARHPDAAQRFRLAQRWRLDHGMPLRVFYKLSSERKPCFLDFSSLALVECFAQRLRAEAAQQSTSPRQIAAVAITEMLPDVTDTWLPGPEGERYTSEFRLVCVNRRLERH